MTRTDLLKACLHAFNEIPNKSIHVEGFKDTYQLAAAIGNALKVPDSGAGTLIQVAKDVLADLRLPMDSTARLLTGRKLREAIKQAEFSQIGDPPIVLIEIRGGELVKITSTDSIGIKTIDFDEVAEGQSNGIRETYDLGVVDETMTHTEILTLIEKRVDEYNEQVS
jgi:hypothetical protein